MHVRLRGLVERAEDLGLDRRILRRGFHHEVGLGRVGGEVRRARDPRERLDLLLLGDLLFLDLAAEVLLDLREARVEPALVYVDEGDVVAGEGEDVGDAVAHRPGADDGDVVDAHG